ncbi:GNAT family protein [Pseudomonas sp. MDMC216]|jgi:[ribosomal protein S5]-alanine N-acetyltransferase|nr:MULTISPECIES: GNAT family protein [Pseudomonas]MBA4683048.1 GNAT family N-acetyltransferase [Pseudomonas sp.]MDH1560141.1 GNAT family N-acetyltransferase [Pseudomonas chengduensis]MDH1731178.1 GNAT family N-acetyltransferase [Pseudomonas chengduensis]MDI5991409.1 GNAT family protein [Pseudomonas sp. MDMC216]MDI6005362.1 GNAT family protein [Pseudomonas sp. MDMC17]
MPDLSVTLTTPRLVLRPLQAADAAALFAIFSDPQVMQYWNTPPWDTEAVAQDFIRAEQQAMHDGQRLTLAIVDRESAELIGKCLLFNYEPESRRAEIGFGITSCAWGKGYVQEAASELLRHGFEALELNRVEAEIDPTNTASGRALERLGFSQEGLLRQRWIIDGQVSDSALYGLLSEDWRSHHSHR